MRQTIVTGARVGVNVTQPYAVLERERPRSLRANPPAEEASQGPVVLRFAENAGLIVLSLIGAIFLLTSLQPILFLALAIVLMPAVPFLALLLGMLCLQEDEFTGPTPAFQPERVESGPH